MMRILALDIANKTGWCLNDETHGVWDFKLKRGESEGMKFIRLESKVKEIHNAVSLDLVVMERPAGRHKGAIISQSQMIGVVKRFCEELKINYSEYSASEIKKFATGKGNCNKDAMIKSAEALGYVVADDNEADAIHLWRMVKKEFYG